jgi:hypothetical protein
MDVHSRLRNLTAELQTMGVAMDQLKNYIGCMETVKVMGVKTMPYVCLPSGTISSTKFKADLQAQHDIVNERKLSIESGLKQKELLEKKIGAETDAVKRKHIDAQVRSVDSQLNTFAYEMGVAKHQIYTLHQLHPIDAEAFYKMLEPKLDELMSLMSLRSEQRLNQIT